LSELFLFSENPVADVVRTVSDAHAFQLARSQETHYIEVDDRYFLQVQDTIGSVVSELVRQFREVRRLKLSDQANRRRCAIRQFFDFHLAIALMAVRDKATDVPMQSARDLRILRRETFLTDQEFLTSRQHSNGDLPRH
jgi:hypothetical protein